MPRCLENFQKAFFESNNYFDFPVLNPLRSKIIDLPVFLDFNTFRSNPKLQKNGVHFFIDDFKFNCIWSNPDRYFPMFSKSSLVIMPDFSLYYDFPIALQIYNKFRNHWLAAYYSVQGLSIVPNVSLSIPDCWDWSFLGYPQNSVVAFSDIGSIKDVSCREIIHKSYDEMLKRITPIQVLYFTRSKNSAPSECDVIELPYFKNGGF